MHLIGYGFIALGVLTIVGGFAVMVAFEHQPQVAERYGTRFMRDASMFGTRVFGAVLVLLGSVLNIAANHFSR